MLLLLFGSSGGGISSPSLEALVASTPDPGHGSTIQRPATSGAWRWVLELADPAAAVLTWHDVTDFYAGDRNQFGADEYMGRARATLTTVQLQTDDDSLAPWGQDTTDLFGVDVPLDAGLLMRAGMIRVVDGVTVEWEPVWTGRVEQWGDASASRGQIRTHVISVVGTTSDLANVPTVIAEATPEWPEWFTDHLLPAADWRFGVDIYGDADEAGLPQDLNLVTAEQRMDAGTDPLGLTWRARRTGRLVIHPWPWDTTHTERYDNPLLGVYPGGLVFSYSPDFTDIEYIADDDQQPFGVQRNVTGVRNYFAVTMPDDELYLTDDPVSIDRYGVKPFQASWILSNPPVVDDLLAARAYASRQALPLRVALDHEGFWPALALVDHLDPVTILHQTRDTGLVVTGTGWIRNVVEERTWRGDGLLSWQSTVQIDLAATETSEPLLPVESLAFAGSETSPFGGPSSAEFTWTNPTQPSVTPTNVQYRVVGRSLIWTTAGYPGVGADGATINWLEPATSYRFQVRLIREVDDVITNFSAIREVRFTTAARILPVPIPGDDPTDTNVDIDDLPFDGCEDDVSIELQENDGSGWVTVDTFSGAEIEQDVDGNWHLVDDIPNSFFNEGSMYRWLGYCGAELVVTGDAFDPPDDWTDPCVTPPALSDPPYSDPSLLVYVPKVCAPDIIREAVSGLEASRGDALDEIMALLGGDPNARVLLAVPDPQWSATPGGIVAYGECPQVVGQTGSKTISARVNIAANDSCVLGEAAAMQLTCSPGTGSDWRAGFSINTVDGVISLLSGDLDVGDVYTIEANFDATTGDIELKVDGTPVDSDTFGGPTTTINALPIWRVGAPPESWITDFAVWSAAVVVEPAQTLPDAILALNPVAYYRLDETSGTTANDSSGNGRHGTYSVPGSSIVLAGVAGPDGANYARFGQGSGSRVSIPDNNAFSINTSPDGLTVFVLIKPDAGIGAADRHLVSKAGSPSSYEWALLFNNTSLGATVWGSPGNNLQSEAVDGLGDMRGAWHAVAFSTPNEDFNTRPDIFLDDNTPESTTQQSVSSSNPYANTGSAVNIGWRGDSPAGGYMIGGGAHVAIFKGEVDLSTVFAAAATDGWI